jgi:integrase
VTIRKLPSGRFQAIVKAGRTQVCSKSFATRREAQAYYAREKAGLAGGVDPRAGRASVRSLLPVWLEERKHAVSPKTYVADAALVRLVPPSLSAMQIAAVTDREITRVLVGWSRHGFAEASVRRTRNSLSSFFAWAVRERLIAVNPVTVTRVPRSHAPRTEMYPFGEEDLERLWERASETNRRLADLVLLAAWTGLRWSELRAIRVRDFVELPIPMLIVQRAEPEGVATKGTKSGKTRRVPVADRVLPIVRELREGRESDDLLCVTATGHQLHATALKRTLSWRKIADGRRIHDLRHTAACLWLARGVDPATVQAWMGHSSIATTNLYLHHLGTASDRAGLARLNQAAGCTRGAQEDPTAESQSREQGESLSSDQVRPGSEMSGAKGTRTPDLLVANETRYRLRHSPTRSTGRSASRLYHSSGGGPFDFNRRQLGCLLLRPGVDNWLSIRCHRPFRTRGRHCRRSGEIDGPYSPRR